jgi:hypothetical protein
MIGARGRPQEYAPAASPNIERLSVVRSSRSTFRVERAPSATPGAAPNAEPNSAPLKSDSATEAVMADDMPHPRIPKGPLE